MKKLIAIVFAAVLLPGIVLSADTVIYGNIPASDTPANGEVYTWNSTNNNAEWTAAGSGDITDVMGCSTGDCASITAGATDLLDFSGVDASTTTEGLILPQHATACAGGTAEGQVCWQADTNVLYVGNGATLTQVGGAETNSLETIVTGIADTEILVGTGVDTGNYVAMSGDITMTNAGVTTIGADAVDSSMISTIVDSIDWNAAGIVADGTQCADAAKVTINSGPVMYTIICTDNDASSMYGHTTMPDGWDGGTVTFELAYIQTAADTNVLNADVTAQCRGATEVPSSTWGAEVAIDDAAVTGSNAIDHTTSAAVTPAGTCAAGDTLWWRVQLDATGTTTAVATLHFTGVKMEYTTNVGD